MENGGECGALWGVSYGSRQNSIEKVGGVCARDGEQCPVREACDAQSHVKGVHGPRDRNSDWGQTENKRKGSLDYTICNT